MKEYVFEYRDSCRYTPSEFDCLGGIWPLRAGRNVAKSNYSVGPRIIDWYSLHFIVSGSLSFSYGNETVQLSQNDIFCLQPNIKHSYSVHHFSPETPLQMVWFACNGAQVPALLKKIGVAENKPFLRNRVTPELLEWVNKLLTILFDRQKNDELKAQANLYSIFDLLANHNEYSQEKAHNSAWLKQSIDYIHAHYMEGISVAEVVRVASVHRSHFYNEFFQLLGISPRQYIINLRMERASEMLIKTDLNITEVSLSTGYSDLYSFSRAFYNYYGLSPSSFRSNRGAIVKATNRNEDKMINLCQQNVILS